MRKLTLTLTAFLFCSALAYAGPETIRSSSKEMKETVAPAPPSCDFSWTGFYLGGNIGYDWANADTTFDPLPTPARFGWINPQSHDPEPDGVIGGGQIGFNWQIGRWFVIGVETDFQGADVEGTEFISPVTPFPPNAAPPISVLETSQRLNWLGTFRGRIGFSPWCRVLIYGTGGLAYGDVDYRGNGLFTPPGFVEFEPASREETNVGWSAGGGLEFAISRHWTIKAEYLHYDLGDQSATATEINNGAPNPPFGVHYTWETSGNIARGGLNFKF